MSLRDVLQKSDFTSLTDADALALLLTTGMELSRDATAYTWSGLSQQLLLAGADATLLIGLDSLLTSLPIGGSMFGKLLDSGGVDFTQSAIRAQIAANQGQAISANQQTVLAACLEVGIKHGTRWQLEGLAVAPVLADITAARATIATDAVRQQLADRYNSTVAAVDAGTAVTWDDVRALLGAE